MYPLSEGKRLLYTFIKPARTMQDIANNPRVKVPVLLMIVIPVLCVALNLNYYHDASLKAMLAMGYPSEMVYSTIQAQLYAQLGTAAIGSIVSWFIVSLGAYVIGQFMEGDGDHELTFKIMRAVTGYAFLVLILQIVLTTINIAVAPDTLLTFSLLDLVGKSLPPDNLYLPVVLQNLSIFYIWHYSLIGIGIYYCKHVSKFNAVLLPLILFILQIAIALVLVLVAIQSGGAGMVEGGGAAGGGGVAITVG